MKRDAEDLEPEFGMNSDNESAEAGQPQKKMRLDDDKARKWRETCSTPSGVPDEQLEIVQHALELSSSTLDIELKPESFVAYPKPGADDAHKYGYLQNCPPASLLGSGEKGHVKGLIVCASATRVNEVAKELEKDCGIQNSKIARVAFTGRGRRKEQKAAHELALQKATLCVTVPGRLTSITELGELELIILDISTDVKGLSLLSQQQSRDSLLEWFTSDAAAEIRQRIAKDDTAIMLF
ncbi:hypothetical protein Pmar_PMAR002363 [Perkinsus marinus ATCC 50983]|uniref:Uncharacterized protein n=1 Tax=Perkinsus marinus (strain ATCC 50983 / TXsc) TaxID=423536 RepID=C5LYQ7_PERM5|nr:hypothetical protein Pmar_PMAR002363 [Perkinsus marinus ATCC 50983]EEQ98081.1 hypothetical protein Pmar_PMAR002363 [Perkinsus marinus ATCC 50983]|eukprot:XP_002765364.1 hypothetical protein Pmar_PMAR002363 [Perkinsus marinus ATCC 50983]